MTQSKNIDPSTGESNSHFHEHEFVSQYPQLGLGRQAIMAAMDHTNAETTSERDPFDVDRLDGLASQYLRLNEVRVKLGELSPDQRQWLNGQIHRQQMSPWLFYAIDPKEYRRQRASNPHTTVQSDQYDYVARLLEKQDYDNVDTSEEYDEYAVSDKTLLNFLEWNNYALARHTEKLNKQKEQLTTTVFTMVERAIADGHLPNDALRHIKRLSTNTLLFADDGLTTALVQEPNAGHFARDAFEPGDIDMQPYDAIVIHPEVIDNPERLLSIFTHEAMHCLSRGGFFKREWGSKILNEAITEHITESLIDDDWIVDPRHRNQSRGIYAEYRMVLDQLCYGGKIHVPIEKFLELYGFDFEFESESRETREAELKEMLTASFPAVDVMALLTDEKLQNDEGAIEILHQLSPRDEPKKRRFKLFPTRRRGQ
jgi:hypothetical protein